MDEKQDGGSTLRHRRSKDLNQKEILGYALSSMEQEVRKWQSASEFYISEVWICSDGHFNHTDFTNKRKK